MIQDIDLRRLSEYEGPERAFLSVYAPGEEGRSRLDHRLTTLRDVLEDQDETEELEHFDENVERVRSWLDDNPPDAGTDCIFACYALDLLEAHRIDLHVPPLARVGVAPYVRPLAELQDEYQTFAVVTADNDATRVFLVTAKESELAGRIRGDVKQNVKKGGWSQKRYERRRDEALKHYASDVADFLSRLARETSFDRLVLLGSEEALVAIEDQLDQQLAERVVARDTVDLDRERSELIEEAYEHQQNAERADERRLWRKIRAEFGRDGLAVTGATDVLQAVLRGQVDTILVERGIEIPGRLCRACETSVHGTPETCPVCGGKSMAAVDLVNELTRQAERTGADVDYADPIPGLGRVGGVAATLRYAL